MSKQVYLRKLLTLPILLLGIGTLPLLALAQNDGGGGDFEQQERNCRSRGGQAVACVACPVDPNQSANFNRDDYSPPRTCGNGDNVFTQAEYRRFVTSQIDKAKQAVRDDSDYKKSNKGFQFGMDAYLDREADYNHDGQGNYSYPQSEIDRAKANARRVENIFSEKVEKLRQDLIADMDLDKEDAFFKETFLAELDEDSFEIIAIEGDDGKLHVEVELKDALLNRSIMRAMAKSINDPAAIAAAKEELENAREEYAKELENHKEELAEAREEAVEDCKERAENQRNERDRAFASSAGGASGGTQGSGVSNSNVGIGFRVDE